MPVVIESKLKRAGGSKIDLYGKTYHFKPESDKEGAPHLCAIPDEDANAIHRLLSIKEGYQLADPETKIPAKPAVSSQTIHADKHEAGKVPEADVVIGDGESAVNLSQMEEPELRQFALEQFKIKSHHKWSKATIITKILEALRGE